MRNETPTREIGVIADEMEAAIKGLREIDAEYSEISTRRTKAINVVNRLQKEFDERVDGLRWSAPQNTDWRQPKPVRAEAA